MLKQAVRSMSSKPCVGGNFGVVHSHFVNCYSILWTCSDCILCLYAGLSNEFELELKDLLNFLKKFELEPKALLNFVKKTDGGRFMALDIDLHKIGVAISDPTNKMAWPIDNRVDLPDTILSRKDQEDRALDLLHAIVIKYNIKGIVVGVSLDELGQKAKVFQDNRIPHFVNKLMGDERFSGLKFCYQEENNTSKVAEFLVESFKKKPKIDNLSGSLILMLYFDDVYSLVTCKFNSIKKKNL